MDVQPMDLDQAELLAAAGHAGRVSTALYAELQRVRAELAALRGESATAELRRMADELDRWAVPGSLLPDVPTVHAITARMRLRADELDGNHGEPDRPPVGG